MATQIRVSVGFNRFSDQQLGTLAGRVIKGMTGNNAFSSLPVDITAVQSALDDFNAALAAQPSGGPSATAAKNNKRDVLVVHLKKLAHHVQLSCDNDLETLLSSGFSAVPP